jgi:hypothetical protein
LSDSSKENFAQKEMGLLLIVVDNDDVVIEQRMMRYDVKSGSRH